MTIYVEGDGKSKPVTMSIARDLFITALVEMRNETLNDPLLESYQDSAQRDVVVANNIIGGVLGIIDGKSELYPAVNFIPYVSNDDIEEAKAAGADYFDNTYGDIGDGSLQDYWNLVNS